VKTLFSNVAFECNLCRYPVANQELVDEIEFRLDEGYSPDDIFVLTPSLKVGGGGLQVDECSCS
jgi:hypothetical protein